MLKSEKNTFFKTSLKFNLYSVEESQSYWFGMR